MTYQLIIFDLDGTILDTLEDLMISVNVALKKNHLPERSLAEVRRFVGNGIGLLIRRAVPEGASQEVIEQVHTDFTAHYQAHCADHTRPYAGIPELMQALCDAGRQIAVVSNKADYAVQELCSQYFPDTTDFAVGEKEGIRRKPAPDSVLAVLEKFGVAPEKAVYVGDSEVDIETAQNAGLDAIIVEWGFRDKGFLIEKGAKTFAADPSILKNLLLD